jgi:ABC-type dipeptide/oligopeptide/nickel transport system ATPase component
MCARVIVLNKGELVETLMRDQIYSGQATQPYTQQLLRATKLEQRSANRNIA